MIRSDTSVLDRKACIDSTIFLGSFFPLASPLLFLLPSHSQQERFHGEELDAGLAECLLFTKHRSSFQKIEMNNTSLTLEDLQDDLGSESAVTEDSGSCHECARVKVVTT